MDQNYAKLVAWVRIDGNGNVIPGTLEYRKLGIKPKDGRWRQISGNYCCGSNDSFLIVINNSTNALNPGANVIGLATNDGSIDWAGVIGQPGGMGTNMLVFVIPNGYDQTFTLTMSSAGSDNIDVATSTISGAGTISAANPNLLTSTVLSTVFNTSATPASQYLVVLTDD